MSAIFTIDGLPAHMTHGREEWQDQNLKVTGWVRDGKVYVAPRIDWSTIDGAAGHYPGSSADHIDTSTLDKAFTHYRNMQHYYVQDRGYSVGYGIGICGQAHATELRGFDIKCAANSAHNGHVVAIYMILGARQAPTLDMVNTFRLCAREIAKRGGRALAVWNGSTGFWISGHNELRQYPPLKGKGTVTQCFGNAARALADTAPVGDGGLFHPRHLTPETPPTPEPTPPATEEDTMLTGYVKHANHPAVYRQWSNGTKTWVPDPDTYAVHQFIDGKSITVNVMPNDAWMKAAGVIVGPHPVNVDGWGIPIA